MRDTIEMVLEAGFWQEHTNTYMCNKDDIKFFEALVRADEREACAKVADRYVMCDPIAKAIRARGETK
jgi:hypothetical protein